jgi:LPS export ABC transporter protein LptC
MARRIGAVSILIFLFLFFWLDPSQAISQESGQTINDFNLSGFAEKGRKAWDIFGKTADIFANQIRLNDFVGKLYGQEDITLTAKRGEFDKVQNRVHLEDNVVITTQSGAELSTDYLDWDRNTAEVQTEASVDIKKDNLDISGRGLKGNTNLKNVDLKQDVRVEIGNKDKTDKTVITCLGPLSLNYAENLAVFQKDVFVDDGQSQIYADLMDVFFEASGSDEAAVSFAGKGGKIQKIVARGNVKIVRGENVSFSEQAVYKAADKTLTLIGRPKLIIYSTEEIDALIGN